jgi:hypothetical protein
VKVTVAINALGVNKTPDKSLMLLIYMRALGAQALAKKIRGARFWQRELD